MSNYTNSQTRDLFYEQYAAEWQQNRVLVVAHICCECPEWSIAPAATTDLGHYEAGYFINGDNGFFRPSPIPQG